MGPRWLATWTASPYDAPPRPPRDSVDRVPRLIDQTLRLVVRTSIGGERVRIRLSNEYGDRPLVIGAAHIAVRDSGASIDPATDRTLTFGGRPSVRMLPGAVVFSDPVGLAVPALKDLAVSLHLAHHAEDLGGSDIERGDDVFGGHDQNPPASFVSIFFVFDSVVSAGFS